MIQLLFGEVRVTELAGNPVLILNEMHGTRSLAIWISANAGSAILSALEGEDARHPSVHDLLLDALSTVDALIESVEILREEQGVFDAQLIVSGSAVTCRVSDGIALALRCGAPILAADELLEGDAGVDAAAAAGHGGPLDPAQSEQVEQFREFLDNVNADDFDGPTE